MDALPLYTLGHSDRSQDALVALLREHCIQAVVDIRAQPHSGRFPHFSEQALRARLDKEGIAYHWAGRQLGGKRAARPDSQHLALEAALRGFADYAGTEPFLRAAAQLMRMATTTPTTVLCAERLPASCHRRILADYLTLQGVSVLHIIRPGECHAHLLSPEARRESMQLIYDRNSNARLDL
jgi:uncharacterized protein (DUF488 family)